LMDPKWHDVDPALPVGNWKLRKRLPVDDQSEH